MLGYLLRRVSPALHGMARNVRTLALGQGQLRSLRERRPVRRDGSVIPWYTYPAIEYLSAFDWSEARVFEFGAGYSSIFWAGRARKVVSVDNDPEWVELLKQHLKPNQQLLLRRDRATYVATLQEQDDDFDLIVVDGRWRHDCAAAAIDGLRPGGMIVIDNNERYPEASKALRLAGFLQVDFNGFGPCAPNTWTTSLFVRADASLQARYAGAHPIGGEGNVILPEQEV